MKLYSQIPKPIADQEVLGSEMAEGLITDATALDIKQVTALQMQAATGVLASADDAFNKSRSADTVAYQSFHAADDALTQFISDTTSALIPFYGKRWNVQWAQVGFITSSLRVPSTIDDRLGLSLRMVAFLTANPTKEAPNQGVTAANGTTRREAVIDTRRLAYDADKDLDSKGTERQAASDALVSLMSTLIGILRGILSPDDPRWYDFGLEKPGKLITPGAPTGLVVAVSPLAENAARGTTSDTITLLLTWDATPFATRYRVRMRIAGLLGANYELVASVTEPMAQIEVPAGTTVEFIVQAVNGNRQSVASESIPFQPLVDARATTSAPAKTPVPIVAPAAEKNGHANGNRVSARK